MDIEKDWKLIKQIMIECGKSSGFYSFASSNPDGTPHVTPIGSLILYEPGHGVYADEFPVQLSRNISHNSRISVMAASSSKWFWLKSLIKGRFERPPGLRLYGTVGEKRLGTEEEISNWLRIVRPFRFFKGYNLLWRDLKQVRDVHFDRVKIITAGAMSGKTGK